MPQVPYTARPQEREPIDPTFAAMAAADLHDAGMLYEVADKQSLFQSVDDVFPGDENEEYDRTWVRSVTRRGRSDLQFQKEEVGEGEEAFIMGKGSDLISIHKKRPKKQEELTS